MANIRQIVGYRFLAHITYAKQRYLSSYRGLSAAAGSVAAANYTTAAVLTRNWTCVDFCLPERPSKTSPIELSLFRRHSYNNYL